MLSIHTPNNTTYPGEFIPKSQILNALAEGVFESDKITTHPSLSISDSEKYYKVELTIPGLKRENLLVTVNEKGNLCILGFNANMKDPKSQSMKKSNTGMDTFLREIPLPGDVDTDFTSATCHAGTLSIIFTRSNKNSRKRSSTIVVY